MNLPYPPQRLPRIVIIGAGFGGLSAAKRLAQAACDVTVVDQHNYHLFQPLLYQVATAALSPGEIAAPIRSILRSQKNVSVILAKVSGVDVACGDVIAEGRRLPFDYLIVATGAEHAYFGHDWASYAPGLKTIDDATYLRRRILLAFERAETEPDVDERRRLLNFVVVGGGATGVEMAGAIAELAKRALASDFRSIDPRSARIILLEAGPRLLTSFDADLSNKAKHSLEQLGVEVRLSAAVSDCDCASVSVGQERIETRTIVWAAGVKASPAAEWLAAEHDCAGRVKVMADLSVPGHPDIFVIGDAAAAFGPDGKPLPGVAPVAKQQGRYVADLLIARLRGKEGARVPLPRFRCARHDRPEKGGRAARRAQDFRSGGLASVEPRTHLFLDWISQSPGRCSQLGLELSYSSARHPLDHRDYRLTHGPDCGRFDAGAADCT